jgi:DNA repair protein RadA/Sms
MLTQCAKQTNIPLFLIGHVNKEGGVAGPKTLEHLIDAVFMIEGERSGELRIVRSLKNRFGPVDEIGMFIMNEKGMEEVTNPSALMIEERASSTPGSVITATMEGTRPLLVEVQALVEKSSYGTPVRRANGMDQNRLQMLIAILSKHAGLHLGESDVYVNVVGGMQLKEPASDLAVCAAIVSATKNRRPGWAMTRSAPSTGCFTTFWPSRRKSAGRKPGRTCGRWWTSAAGRSWLP